MATALRTATWPSASPMQFFGPEENGKKRGAPDTGSTAASGSDQRSGLKVRASGPQLDAELLITNRQGKTVTCLLNQTYASDKKRRVAHRERTNS